MLRSQRILSVIQSVTDWQRYTAAGGSHVDGAWSPFDRFDAPDWVANRFWGEHE
ncbi:hypothetical protein ACFUTR_33590 [Streptomyces sp. NPDC057367]|uniref:hypothetical protein n=1 Tax=Streptomyces sp. NPDC057367 TaxID=3346108 RepID=UPI003642FBAF